ncbi:MAG: galactokinase [Phycisphaerales bacterium]|nr:galactokinase [Phycisphaerales bacterium]
MTAASPKPELLHNATEIYRSAFGRAPVVCGWAPGRVNLIGEHVDYCGGFVLPVAIDRQTVAVSSGFEPGGSGEGGVVLVSAARPGERVEWRLTEFPRLTNLPVWCRYIAAVIGEALDGADPPPGTIHLAIAGDVPIGAGLSSSASLEVAVALLFEAVTGRARARVDTARLCRRAEHAAVGVPCGIMDQYTAALAEPGRAVRIDCEIEAHRSVPLPESVRVVVADSGVKHALAAGDYAACRASCERALAAIVQAVGPRPNLRRCSMADLLLASGAMKHEDFARARHVILECGRVSQAVEALLRADLATVGRLMAESHASLRDDFKVSCKELDELVERALGQPGVIGARMTGGGFGGCIVALVEAPRASEVVAALGADGRLAFQTPAAGAGGAASL